MTAEQARFWVVQVVGGTAVLGSYAWGIQTYPDQAPRLWGTIPEAAIGPYAACMPFAAAGYLGATAWWWSRRDDGLDPITRWLAVALAASALWMPLSLWALDQGDASLLPGIQLDLALTAVASLALAGQLWRARCPTWTWRLVFAGWLAFCFQTVVLDALVWPRFFVV